MALAGRWPGWFEVPIRSLVLTSRQVQARSLMVVGSAASGPDAGGGSVSGPVPGDLDLHLVVRRWSPEVADVVLGALGRALRQSAVVDHRDYRLELRHGPFKPPPDRRIDQVHLLVDDDQSIERSPWALRWYRAATGYPLFGRPDVPAMCSAPRQLREARRELIRWRSGLVDGHIPFREWRGERDPRLVDGRAPVTDDWEQHCLVHAARASVNLHVRALAVRPDPAGRIFRTAREEMPDVAQNHGGAAEREIARIASSLRLLRLVREESARVLN